MAHDRDEESRVRPADVHVSTDLRPRRDDHFAALLERALADELAVYFAAVPLGQCVPYDVDYRPDLHPAGAAAIEQALRDAHAHKFPPLIVYPRGVWFVVADDYIPLFAALRGRPDYVPAMILGEPGETAGLADLQGPLASDVVRRALGF